MILLRLICICVIERFDDSTKVGGNGFRQLLLVRRCFNGELAVFSDNNIFVKTSRFPFILRF